MRELEQLGAADRLLERRVCASADVWSGVQCAVRVLPLHSGDDDDLGGQDADVRRRLLRRGHRWRRDRCRDGRRHRLQQRRMRPPAGLRQSVPERVRVLRLRAGGDLHGWRSHVRVSGKLLRGDRCVSAQPAALAERVRRLDHVHVHGLRGPRGRHRILRIGHLERDRNALRDRLLRREPVRPRDPLRGASQRGLPRRVRSEPVRHRAHHVRLRGIPLRGSGMQYERHHRDLQLVSQRAVPVASMETGGRKPRFRRDRGGPGIGDARSSARR